MKRKKKEEELSGDSENNVRVHYNSSRPEKLKDFENDSMKDGKLPPLNHETWHHEQQYNPRVPFWYRTRRVFKYLKKRFRS